MLLHGKTLFTPVAAQKPRVKKVVREVAAESLVRCGE